MYRTKGLRGALCTLLALMICLPLVPLNAHAQTNNGMLRVLLSRLNITDRLDITLSGVYSVGNPGEASMVFDRGSQLTVMLNGGQLYVYYQGLCWNAGESLYFNRHQAAEGQENGLRLQGGNNLYEGDLFLSAQPDQIQAILTIYVEDYLLGVVPYEMSNNFPLEALKAQAVAARTYALRKAGSSGAYDLVDTTNDQVYKGYHPEYLNAYQAVKETAGICAYDGNKLAQCYYTASNGGQTEKVSHVWGGNDVSYLTYVDDPYDILNPLSVVKSYTLPKTGGLSDQLMAALAPYLAGTLSAQGFDSQGENIRIDQILSATLDTPLHNDGSRIMTQLTLEVMVSGRRQIVILPQDDTAAMAGALEDDEEISLFSTPAPSLSSAPSAVPSAIPTPSPALTPEPTPEPTPAYTDFIALSEPITLTLNIFGALENAMNLSINTSDNEVITLTETENGYILQSRRFGHGVGMSQRGAEYMAGQENKTYEEIISFYYPGVTLKQAIDKEPVLTTLNPQQLSTPGPMPTATPRPTLMPVTQQLPQGARYAAVTEIDEDSSLNLRNEPNTGGDILMRLYKNQTLIVLESCEEEGWVKVKTDVAEGYVMESFLTYTDESEN